MGAGAKTVLPTAVLRKTVLLGLAVAVVLVGFALAGDPPRAEAQSGCTIKGNFVETGLSQQECDALVPLFDANLSTFTYSPYDRDPCFWSQIRCESSGVVGLVFEYSDRPTETIEVLPASLGGLEHLRELRVSNAPVESFPAEILRAPLETLVLWDVRMAELPDEIGDETTLRTLEWYPRAENAGVNDNITRLSELEHLSLAGRFKGVPESLGNMRALTSLSIYGYGATSLPTSMANLTNLEEAEFNYFFELSSFPDVFENLDKLRTLEFNQMDKLTKLPPSLGGATSLETLVLDTTAVTELPDSLGNLRRLKELTAHVTPIKGLPDSMANLTELRTFDFLHTDIRELPNWIGNWRKLEVLTVEGSLVAELPPTIGQLTRLRTLNLASLYSLSELPKELAKLRNLEVLNFDRSNITVVPPELGKIPTLKGVSITEESSLLFEGGCAPGSHDFVVFMSTRGYTKVSITDASGTVSTMNFEPGYGSLLRGTAVVGEGPYDVTVTLTEFRGQTTQVLSEKTSCSSVCGGVPGSSTDGVVMGTDADDVLTINENRPVTVCGLGGNDTLTVTAPEATVFGGAGDDTITVTADRSTVWGSSGNDTITATGALNANGGPGDDTITGGAGDDMIDGRSGNDKLAAGAGRDQIRGGTGDDTIDGGPGNDYLLSGNGGRDTITGGTGDDIIYGGPRADIIYGGDGNDIIKGLAGADKLFGQNGADDLFAGKGNDTLDGGNDTDACKNYFGIYTTLVSCENAINTAQLVADR